MGYWKAKASTPQLGQPELVHGMVGEETMREKSMNLSFSIPFKDIEFAQHLHQELESRDREPWVDWRDIPPTAEWLDEVYAGIQAA